MRSKGVFLGLFMAVALSGPPLQAQDLAPLVSRLTGAWGSEDTATLGSLMAPTVRLSLEGESHMGVPPRQVVASLQRLFHRYRPDPPDITRQREPAESDTGGFVEFRWSPVTEDTGEQISYVVFVVFRRAQDEWRVSELRVLR